jgi:aspartyl-tRNA(Asn)/glutamyl-tRNA(Gln) amidotransferase subunit A
MKPSLSELSLSTAIEHLRQRDYSAIELTEACLQRIASLNPIINAFITPTLELAVGGAMQADVIFANNPSNIKDLILLGLPIGIKDMFDVAGVATSAGSKFFLEDIPKEDAAAVLKLKLSGAVILGKTNTHEIALGVTGINPHYGAVKNPWDLSRITGGSSSGSAAAVSSGMCLAAIGTDTGGSIRIPAALCGVVGLKPTYGRISTRGVIPLSWSLDHIGPLTRSVRDAAIMLGVMAGFDPHDPASANTPSNDYINQIDEGVGNWRIALASGEYFETSDMEVLAFVNEAGKVFKDLGAQVEKVDLSWLAELAMANSQMTQADGAAYHRDRLMKHPEWFGADVYQRLQNGSALSSSEYALAHRKQAEGGRRFETIFEKFDILLLPTTPVPAPKIEDTGAIEAARQLTRFTSPFNLTGLPAMSVPCGFTKTGLPVGMQIVSRRWAEAKVLTAGRSFEQATEWHKRCPNV